jgi:UDP-2,3-diacylglucosamine hydrolase
VSKPYLFTADLHLGSESHDEEARKEAALLSLLERSPDLFSGLALLGDLFDFWFEYRHAIPRRAARALARLATLHESGFPVLFVGGNHDFWLADFLHREYGLDARREPATLEVGGRRVLAAHGDELVAAGDPGYRVLKKLLRARVAGSLFRSVHPDIGIPLGRTVSRWSRDYTSEKEFFLGDALRASIERAFAAGHDAVVMGHLHKAEHLRLPGGECLVLGGWSGRLSTVVLEAGAFRHEPWPPDGGGGRS